MIEVNLDVMLSKRKMSSGELAAQIGITQANLSILKTGKAKAIRFSTLEAICRGFGITLAQFFAEGDMVELTPELKELFDNWLTLTAEQKQATLTIVRAFQHDR